MDTSQTIYTTAAILSWTTLLWILYRTRTMNETILQTWGFVAAFGGATTVQIEPVYVTISRAFAINNLAWLLSYCLGATAVYLTITALHRGLKIRQNLLIMRRILYGTLLALLLIFPSIARLPNIINHTNPTTGAEIMFMLVLYLYGGLACLAIAHTFFKLQENDAVLHSRLRWLVIVITSVCASLFFFGRIPYIMIVFIQPALISHPVVAAIQYLNDITFFTCLGWVLFFLPTQVFLALAIPIETADKLLALRDLNAVQKRVAALCAPVAPVILNRSWREWLRNLDFHLYRAIITVLDGKKVLADYFADITGEADASEEYSLALASRQPTWNNTQAWHLYQALRTVPDDTSYEQMVTAYRQIGRLYRKRVFYP
jgi:hypothetical protein